MKKIILSLSVSLLALVQVQAADIHVSLKGNDLSDGQSSPKASLQSALREVREWRRINSLPEGEKKDLGESVRIILEEGTYFMEEPLLIRPEDSGTEDCPTLICAAEGAQVVLSGGIRVEGWKKLSKAPSSALNVQASKVWVAELPRVAGRPVEPRQLYVNGQKALKACDVEDSHSLDKVLSVDREGRSITVAGQFKAYEGDRPELFVHQMWETALLRIKDMKVKDHQTTLWFESPESRLEFEHPWPPIVISEQGNSPYRISGMLCLLDKPGEWYADYDRDLIYYIPREGENMKKAEVFVPWLETLVRVEGSLDSPVHHIGFAGITFSHSAWNRPSEMGYVPLQAGMYLLDAYKLLKEGTPAKAQLENQAWIGRQPASVCLRGVQNTFFENCSFEHLGAAGLDYIEGAFEDRVEGCRFQDIAGSALVAGKFSDPGIETHLAYQPQDLREVCSAMSICNNYIYDCANEYWGCVGIIAGYVRDFRIEHNEVAEMPYSGISVGWGWIREANCMKDNLIRFNNVHHFGRHNYSCGGIYTLSAQVGTLIEGNWIHDIYHPEYVHDKTQGHYIYLDEASSWMTIRNNWCTEAKFGQNQPGLNLWENNGPQVSEDVCREAGLEKQWEFIRK